MTQASQPPADGGECPFCQIIAGSSPARTLLRTSEVAAFFPLEPATLGHTLVIPTRHIADIWHLDDEAAELLTKLTLRLARAIRDSLNPDGLNIIQSNGLAATQTVMHLHVHIVPRWTNDSIPDFWPAKSPWSEKELDHAQRSIESHL